MAWLQNLAGKAEDLLNKIDQNAATVLNESSSKSIENETQIQDTLNLANQIKEYDVNSKVKSVATNRSSSSNASPVIERSPVLEKKQDITHESSSPSFSEPRQFNRNILDNDSNMDESIKSSMKSDKLSSSSSINNSFIFAEETQLLNEKIAKLEVDNQDINKQLLNMQHLYSALRQENSNLQFQIERANEQVAEAQIEKDQYIARAQRILHEKEKLISLKQENTTEDIFGTYNEELKKELEFHQAKSEELNQKNVQLLKEIQSLQMQHQVIQNGLQSTNQSLEQTLMNEKKIRAAVEEDCIQKNNELFKALQKIHGLEETLKAKINEVNFLQDTVKTKRNIVINEDVESRIKSLTQTLMLKQHNLETVTTERNALKLQMEKLEDEYKKNLAQINKSQAKVINIIEPDDSVPVPKFIRVSPFDAGVTRRVKHAYSTLDAVSIRTGIFLRRYPAARVFVFCYMILLHIWVLVILCLYAPSNR